MGKKLPRHSRHAPSRAERRRRGRYVGWVVLGVPALLFVLYLIDRTGPLETVDGTVMDTATYPHNSGDRPEPHTHIEAVLEFEGRRHTVRPGDRFARGDLVKVEVIRGRFSGYAYFVQAGRF